MDADGIPRSSRRLGRYVLHDPIASGGMATVHLGRMLGPVGFSRVVAIKRLHAHLAHDPDFVAMFLDEARLAARVHHPNVISALDVVATGGEVFLVMEYVRGESLHGLLRAAHAAGVALPRPVLSSIVGGVLHGLHAAHEATTERGEPLRIVHRDVSPHNVLVGEDGVARLVDFGVAKAVWRVQSTQDGQVKGKLSYMAPEQVSSAAVDHRADVYAAAVVLWEALTGLRLFKGDNPGAIVHEILVGAVPPPSARAEGIAPELDALVARGMAKTPDARFASALAMATELARIVPPAPQGVVAAWVRSVAADVLDQRAQRVAAVEAMPALPEDAPDGDMPAAASSALHQISNAPTQPEIPVASVPIVFPTATPAELAGELSSVSVTGHVRPRAPRSRSRALVPWAGGALLGAVAGAALLASTRSGRGVPAPSVAAPSASMEGVAAAAGASSVSPGIAPSAVPPGEDGTTASPPSALASAASVPAPGPSAAPPTTPRTSSPTARPGHAAAPLGHAAASRPASVPARNCNPPYTLDPTSVSPEGQPLKRFKPWCL